MAATITVNWRFNFGSDNAKAITFVPDNSYPATGYVTFKSLMGFAVQPKFVAAFMLHNPGNGQMLLAKYDRTADAIRIYYPNSGAGNVSTSSSINTGAGGNTTGGSVATYANDLTAPGLEVQGGANLTGYTGDTLVIGE